MKNTKILRDARKKTLKLFLELKKNPVSIIILIASLTIFSIAFLVDPEKIRFLAFNYELWPTQWYTIITYGFVHVDLNHIIVNMGLLIWIGIWVERLIGSKRFVLLVLTGILSGGLTLLLRETAGIGFSAAAAALLFYYHFAFPYKRELPFNIPNIVLPIVLLIISISAIIFGWLPNIGHYPHIAGAIVGVVFLGFFHKTHKRI